MSSRAVELNHSRSNLRPRPARWCVLISGRGSNLAALLEKPNHEVRLVVSSDPAADGLAKARRAGVETIVLSRNLDRSINWSQLQVELERRSIDAIFLLGFMRIVPASFLEKWEGRILNLHPSLLPKYPGLKSIERAIEAHDDCGATVHEVVSLVDAGTVLKSRTSFARTDFNELEKSPVSETAIGTAIETLVHIDEQRLVKEIVERWHPQTPR